MTEVTLPHSPDGRKGKADADAVRRAKYRPRDRGRLPQRPSASTRARSSRARTGSRTAGASRPIRRTRVASCARRRGDSR